MKQTNINMKNSDNLKKLRQIVANYGLRNNNKNKFELGKQCDAFDLLGELFSIFQSFKIDIQIPTSHVYTKINKNLTKISDFNNIENKIINLEINKNEIKSVQDAINIYLNTEEISELTIGEQKGKGTKRIFFDNELKIPDYLIFFLKRFDENLTKNDKNIENSFSIKIKFCDFKNNIITKEVDHNFKLKGIICHHGKEISTGHYFMYRLENNKWFEYNSLNDDRNEVSFEKIPNIEGYIYLYLNEKIIKDEDIEIEEKN
jgi:uncharacterized UBP type Zn finger protein